MIEKIIFTELGICQTEDGIVTLAFSDELVGLCATEFFELLDRQIVDYVVATVDNGNLSEIIF